ncbi:hypothetical protein HOLleu_13106 [Holothuria leucospilota]|uniref:Uncharacterized protein n=1 Tax=Holothuria leucospilota TaxID=206669 RepID=A0A9Q1HAL8_HOLLE|nr:hypothetical protein HOLleu_13106 [Holothuria leucospilota]
MHEVNQGRERVFAAADEMSFEGNAFKSATVEAVLVGMSHSYRKGEKETKEVLFKARNTAYFLLRNGHLLV